MKRGIVQFLLLMLLGILAACGNETAVTPNEVQASVEAGVAATAVAQAVVSTSVSETVVAQSLAAGTATVAEDLPATNTVTATETAVDTATPPATNTTIPTAGATATIPTNTPVPTDTAVPTDTPEVVAATSAPAPTAPPPIPVNPVFGGDILLNDSFEGGWYNMWGLPELQLPNAWVFEWDEGPTGFGTEDWDQWYRPETRVLPYYQLPAHEQSFIRSGEYTIKIFKGYGPISFRMFQDAPLEAGTYKFTVRAFPDLVHAYDNGNKVWASEDAGEIRFIAPDGGTGWILPGLGRWNTFEHTFTLTEPATVRFGIGIRARYGLINNGWFFDDWDLQKLEG
jgi:hypothetical protein